ncbi:MAG: acetylglutamate kinase [Verrucomicrobia bacterium]|nr:acetylglutamate kinase [Verrucomicrobiota bacterium]
MEKLIAKAATLLEALPYIQKYAGARFVIKYGGSFMDSDDPVTRSGVARDIVFLQAVRIRPVIVHGGGKAISRAMKEAGLKPKFIQGLRVTDERAARIVDEVLSRRINPELVALINSLGGRARGFPGPSVLRCQPVRPEGETGEPIDLGFVGKVIGVDTAPLWECLEQGITPVLSPTAQGPEGRIYNCNADVVAAQVAIALRARRLVFMSDVPGLLSNPNDPESVIPHLRVDEVESLKQSGVIDKGMIPKVDSGVQAVQEGVDKVSFVDGRTPHAILLEIFTHKGVGTEVVM